MADQYLLVQLKVGGEFFNHVDRAMLAASAADTDGQVAAVIGLKRRQPFIDKNFDVGE